MMKICSSSHIPQQVRGMAGVGLRAQHYQQVLREKPDIPWFEVHSENFFSDGGISRDVLLRIRQDYPVSLHGVGLSLGTYEGLNKIHLKKLKNLIDLCNPFIVSEHISWSASGGIYANDLLPLPYNKESINTLVNNIGYAQDYLKRNILVENPSTYLEFVDSDMAECDFINEISHKTGCHILLDVNNVYVSCKNNGHDAEQYINNISKNSIQEIHLSGHSKRIIENCEVLIDTHDNYISNDVWDLYRKTIDITGARPTLIEWDNNIPELKILMEQAGIAQSIMDNILCPA